MPEILNAMLIFRQQLRSGEARAQAVMLRRWLEVERALQADVTATVERIQRLQRQGIALTPWRVMELDRYQSLVAQSRRQITNYVDSVALPVTSTRQLQLIDLGQQHATTAHAVLGVRAQFGRLPVDVVQNLAGVAGDGSPLRDLLRSSYGNDEADAILTRMITGVARGQNPTVIARDVVRHGYSQSLTRMLSTMRTEPLRAYRHSSLEIYRQNRVVIGYRRLAAHDDRTCLGCLIADGTFLGLDTDFESHVSCRCGITPVLSDEEPDWEVGEEWFERQEPETQRRMMGEGKYKAWQDGQFQLKQLVKHVEDRTWGNAIVPTPLNELIAQ
jgi:hypothetical protein